MRRFPRLSIEMKLSAPSRGEGGARDLLGENPRAAHQCALRHPRLEVLSAGLTKLKFSLGQGGRQVGSASGPSDAELARLIQRIESDTLLRPKAAYR
jgi:hypothetical protein